MSSIKLDTQIRQEQIVQAVLSVVAHHGLKKLSVAMVARSIGLVPSAIYRHFKSKDKMLDAVLDFIEMRLLKNVEIVSEETTDALGKLHALLILHIQLIRENEAIPRIVFSEEVFGGHPDRKKRLRSLIHNYLGKVSEIIQEGQTQNLIQADLDSKTLCVMFLGLIQPAAILWNLSDGGFDVTKHGEKIWKIFAAAIRI